MRTALVMIARVLSVAVGLLLILMSVLLYETEEGTIQNKLEQWWIFLSDTEATAVKKHAAFMAGVTILGGRVFDRLFGQKLFSLRSVGVSACLSLASLGIVCSPGLSTLLLENLPGVLYALVVTLLLLVGLLPAVLGPRLPRRLWIVGVAALTLVSLSGMHAVDWFSVIQRKGEVAEVAYDLFFIIVTVGFDTLFIVVTRWLLRRGSGLGSRAKILGLMIGNVALACLLVVLPMCLAWGVGGLVAIIRSESIITAAEWSAAFSTPWQNFLTSLAASNVLDGLAASIFFILLFALLLHRLLWPTVQRPVYALATRGIVRRRKLFFVLGVVLVGVGGMPKPAIGLVKKIVSEFLD